MLPSIVLRWSTCWKITISVIISIWKTPFLILCRRSDIWLETIFNMTSTQMSKIVTISFTKSSNDFVLRCWTKSAPSLSTCQSWPMLSSKFCWCLIFCLILIFPNKFPAIWQSCRIYTQWLRRPANSFPHICKVRSHCAKFYRIGIGSTLFSCRPHSRASFVRRFNNCWAQHL